MYSGRMISLLEVLDTGSRRHGPMWLILEEWVLAGQTEIVSCWCIPPERAEMNNHDFLNRFADSCAQGFQGKSKENILCQLGEIILLNSASTFVLFYISYIGISYVWLLCSTLTLRQLTLILWGERFDTLWCRSMNSRIWCHNYM